VQIKKYKCKKCQIVFFSLIKLLSNLNFINASRFNVNNLWLLRCIPVFNKTANK